jgi:ribonucleotide monophosphatase NagD (HAD superfamily)
MSPGEPDTTLLKPEGREGMADHKSQVSQQLWDLEHISSRQPSAAAALFSGIYAVGDNPAADIRGANQAGEPWVSVLVRTGVFQGAGVNSESDPAHMVVTDVLAAVQAALHRTRSSKWHSMR